MWYRLETGAYVFAECGVILRLNVGVKFWRVRGVRLGFTVWSWRDCDVYLRFEVQIGVQSWRLGFGVPIFRA